MNATEIRTENASAIPAAKARVLVVDDEQTMQLLASTIIRKLGYDADSASSGEEAVELFRQSKTQGHGYDAVVMDLALPGGISGLEATLAIKQIDGGAKVIVSSGYLEQNARNAALEHGFAGFFQNPTPRSGSPRNCGGC